MASPERTRRVAVLLFDEVEVLDFAGPFEVFGVAGRERSRPPFEVFTVSPDGGEVTARNGLRVASDRPLADAGPVDVLVVPGGLGVRREMRRERVIDELRTVAGDAELVLSVCTGALLLGAAGLLDGLHATTHRSALDELREAAPGARIHPEARGVDNGRIVVAAGIAAGIDMALYAVARLCGADVAAESAGYMHHEWRHREPDGETIVRPAEREPGVR